MGTFSHFTSDGDVHMVNVGAKTSTDRRARASAKIQMQATTLEAIVNKQTSKGDVLQVARLAGIMALNRRATSSLSAIRWPRQGLRFRCHR